MRRHSTDVELDYFSAVDDITATWQDSTGSGHMGHTEHSAGTFYRYATIDLRDLAANIGGSGQDARELTESFLASFIESVPKAKKNSTAPHTLPSLIHLSVRSDRPLSYAAAFEKPVRAAAEGGFAEPSTKRLAEYAQAANAMLGNGRILTSGWLSMDTKELDGLGDAAPSLDDLISRTVTTALAPAANKGPA